MSVQRHKADGIVLADLIFLLWPEWQFFFQYACRYTAFCHFKSCIQLKTKQIEKKKAEILCWLSVSTVPLDRTGIANQFFCLCYTLNTDEFEIKNINTK